MARDGLAAATERDGRIYAIGGTPDPIDYAALPLHSLSTVEALDPRTGCWTRLPSLQATRFWLGAAAAKDGTIYAIGGSDSYAVEALTVPAAGTRGP